MKSARTGSRCWSEARQEPRVSAFRGRTLGTRPLQLPLGPLFVHVQMFQSGCHFSRSLFLNLVVWNSSHREMLSTMDHLPNIQALPCFSLREVLGNSANRFQGSNLRRFPTRKLPSQKLEKGNPPGPMTTINGNPPLAHQSSASPCIMMHNLHNDFPHATYCRPSSYRTKSALGKNSMHMHNRPPAIWTLRRSPRERNDS